MVPGTLEFSEIFVDTPEQMDFERGLFITTGTGVVVNWTVSFPVHPLALVTLAS